MVILGTAPNMNPNRGVNLSPVDIPNNKSRHRNSPLSQCPDPVKTPGTGFEIHLMAPHSGPRNLQTHLATLQEPLFEKMEKTNKNHHLTKVQLPLTT